MISACLWLFTCGHSILNRLINVYLEWPPPDKHSPGPRRLETFKLNPLTPLSSLLPFPSSLLSSLSLYVPSCPNAPCACRMQPFQASLFTNDRSGGSFQRGPIVDTESAEGSKRGGDINMVSFARSVCCLDGDGWLGSTIYGRGNYRDQQALPATLEQLPGWKQGIILNILILLLFLSVSFYFLSVIFN